MGILHVLPCIMIIQGKENHPPEFCKGLTIVETVYLYFKVKNFITRVKQLEEKILIKKLDEIGNK